MKKSSFHHLEARRYKMEEVREIFYPKYSKETWSIYILDTNVIIDCPNFIPSLSTEWIIFSDNFGSEKCHFIIPETVILELDSFKHEASARGEVARKILKDLRCLFEKVDYRADLIDSHSYPSLFFEEYNRIFTVIPRPHLLAQASFYLEKEDLDGQILLTAVEIAKSLTANTTLLTNDHAMAIRANTLGIHTLPFHFTSTKACYTGRRKVKVPDILFENFMNSGRDGIFLAEWQDTMPNEKSLTANEFIIMSPNNPNLYNSYSSSSQPYWHIGRFDYSSQRIVHLTYFKDLNLIPKSDGQVIYAEAIAHPDIQTIIVTGPAGSGKTFIPTIGGIEACKAGKYFGITIVPCSVEVQREFGALPGDLNDKISPNIAPIKNAISNYCKYSDRDVVKAIKAFRTYGDTSDGTKVQKGKQSHLSDSSMRNSTDHLEKIFRNKKTIRHRLKDCVDMIYNNWFENVPVDAARGLDFSDQFVIFDEFQDQNTSQADMLLKRTGRNCKVVISGDINQIHQTGLNKYNNGISYAKRLCCNLPMVAFITLTSDEVIRSDLVQMIAKRQELSE